MEHEAEEQAMAEVHRRLAERHPEQDDAAIRQAVHDAHSRLDGPIRDFVPVLVEHAAHDALREMDRNRVGHEGSASR